MIKTHCIRNHDLRIFGRNATGHCKVCQKEASAPRNWRDSGMLNGQGSIFTRLDYDRLYQIQNGCCALCGKHQSEVSEAFAVDHNHSTGYVRGLLCRQPCNLRIISVVEGYNHLIAKARIYLKRGNVS